MFERFTEPARRSIFYARYEAAQFGNKSIEPYHLLLGIVHESEKLRTRVLGTATLDDLRAEFAHFGGFPKISLSVDLPLSNSGKRVLAYAAEEAHKAGSALIDAEHLLAGLLRESTPATEALAKRGINLQVLRQEFLSAAPSETEPRLEALPKTITPGMFESARMFERYTALARRSFFFARFELVHFGGREIEPSHLLLGILRGDAALRTRILGKTTLDELRAELPHLAGPSKTATLSDAPISEASKRVMAFAAEEADMACSPGIAPEHLLAGLLREGTPAAEVLEKRGITLPVIRQDIMSARPGDAEKGVEALLKTILGKAPASRDEDFAGARHIVGDNQSNYADGSIHRVIPARSRGRLGQSPKRNPALVICLGRGFALNVL